MRGPPSHFEAHSSPQQTQVLFRARPERRRVAREYDAALEQDEVPVAELEQLFHFLVDDQGRDPLIAKPPDGGPDLLADERSKAFGGDPVGRPPADRLAIDAHFTRSWRGQTEHAADGGGLPHAVAAHQGDGLAGPDGEGDPMQDMARAVEGVQIGRLQERAHGISSPRYASRTAGLARISDGDPVANT